MLASSLAYLCAVREEEEKSSTLRRIGIVGPESAGKTTISQALAAWYGCRWVKEYARTYLSSLSRPVEESDLLSIAKHQHTLEETLATIAKRQKDKLLISDTTQLVMHIWGIYQYGRSHLWIEKAFATEQYSLQLLCTPDIPWSPDPLRSLPALSARQKVFDMYEGALQKKKCPYVVLKGRHFYRLQQATVAISAHF